MKKNQENTFGTKLANAFNLATVLAGFENYKPPRVTDTLEEYNKLISAIQEANNASAISKQHLSSATEQSQQLVAKHNLSIRSLLSPIHSAIRAQYGFKSKEAADVSGKLRSMRGIRKVKPAANAALSEGDAVKTVSTSHQAVGSIAQSFADMIALIGELSPAFDPANADLNLENLRLKYIQIMEVSNRKASSIAAWKKARELRNSQYLELKDRTRRIKISVKSQYGTKSAEYDSIKSLSV